MIEKTVEKNQARLAEIDTFIADESFYSEERRDERVKLLEEHGTLSRETAALEEEWMELLEQIEAINADGTD